jgi:hypothetical protein
MPLGEPLTAGQFFSPAMEIQTADKQRVTHPADLIWFATGHPDLPYSSRESALEANPDGQITSKTASDYIKALIN